MSKVYTDKDADLGVLKNKMLAVLGFGSQGHAHALNLKDSGLKVIIGLYEGSKSIPVAKEKGFEVVTTAEAVKRADVIMVALPDTKQAKCYKKDIEPNLTAGRHSCFPTASPFISRPSLRRKRQHHHGFAEGPGHAVRRIHRRQGRSLADRRLSEPRQGREEDRARWAEGIGGTRAGVLETNFKEEAESDLFGEQTVLCGGASALLQAGFEVLSKPVIRRRWLTLNVCTN